jgi:hypothetical protein
VWDDDVPPGIFLGDLGVLLPWKGTGRGKSFQEVETRLKGLGNVGQSKVRNIFNNCACRA